MIREPLSTVDLAWLRMDRPTNLMVITGLMTFSTPLSMDRLRAVSQRILLCYARFRQRVVFPPQPFGRVYWEECEDFDLDDHILRVRLLPPGGETQLQDFISEIMAIPLEPERPLWRMYLIEHYGAGSALVVRLHHCMADGIALVQVLLSMATNSPDLEPPIPTFETKKPPSAPGSPLERSLLLGAELAGKVSAEVLHGLTNPRYATQQARQATRLALALGRLVLRMPDPPTIFRGEPTFEKRVAWSVPLDLNAVKATAHSLGATINDLLLACVAGALGSYGRDRGHLKKHVQIRAMIPVNLRADAPALDLGNRFGLVFLALPLDIEDPLDRLHELKRRMDELKGTPEAVVALGVLAVMGAMPEAIQDVGVMIFEMKGTAVMTNVPGPRQQLYLAGAPIESVMAWVPSAGNLTLGVSILSYHGLIWLGLATDRSLVPDPERIVALFNTEFTRMQELAAHPLRRQPQTVAEMLAALDQVEMALDEVKLERARQVPDGHCHTTTRRGQPCQNPALPGKTYCRIHRPG